MTKIQGLISHILSSVVGAGVWAILFYFTTKLTGDAIPLWGWVLIGMAGSVHFTSKEKYLKE